MTIGKNLTRFLENEITRCGSEVEANCSISLKILRYIGFKQNAITYELHRANKIAIAFNYKVKCITMNLLSAGLPRNFIKNTIEYFNKNKDDFLFLE